MFAFLQRKYSFIMSIRTIQNHRIANEKYATLKSEETFDVCVSELAEIKMFAERQSESPFRQASSGRCHGGGGRTGRRPCPVPISLSVFSLFQLSLRFLFIPANQLTNKHQHRPIISRKGKKKTI
jgi:hypothetical protein